MSLSPPIQPKARSKSNSSAEASGSASTLTSAPDINHTTRRPRAAKSLPPWIDSYEQNYGPATDDQLRLLRPPPASTPPKHNSNWNPAEPERRVSRDGFVDLSDTQLGPPRGERSRIPHIIRYGRASMRGRQWDHLRSAEPVIVPGYLPANLSPSAGAGWHQFIRSSAYGPMTGEESEVVDVETLDKLHPNFNRPVNQSMNPLDAKKSRRRRAIAPYKRVWNFILRHPFSPLLFRMIVMITSLLALGIAGRIYHVEDAEHKDTAERTQSIVAVVVDCVAVPYIGYMIWDEYTGKPIGLRSGVSKISLILLDLFFIIFKSASTALAFESLVYHNVTESSVRRLAKALATFMLIGLMSWTINFTVNIFRTVERLGGGEDEDHN